MCCQYGVLYWSLYSVAKYTAWKITLAHLYHLVTQIQQTVTQIPQTCSIWPQVVLGQTAGVTWNH